MESTKTLTTKQTALLNYLRFYFERNHYAPTYEEIRVGMGWSTKSLVDYQLNQLEKACCITRQRNTPRAIVVIAEVERKKS
jgi:SOS-response transcriptional repressor LexA